MRHRSRPVRALATAGLACTGTLLLAGCSGGPGSSASDDADPALAMIARMDALPPEEQLPNWSVTRELMLRTPPAVGEPAPDFALATFDGSEVITLSEFQPTRPVVLVFGSWT